MVAPIILPRMKNAHQFPGLRVSAGEVGSLVEIAVRASQREVVECAFAAMLSRDDVLDMEWRIRFVVHSQATVFAAIAPS